MKRKIISIIILAIVGLSLTFSSYQPILSFKGLESRAKSINELDVSENIYSALLLNNTPIMKVRQRVGVVEYLRQNVYVTYEGGRWKGKESNVSRRILIEKPSVPHREVRDHVTIELEYPLISGNLYTTLYTTSISIPYYYYLEFSLFRPVNYPVRSYSFDVVKYDFPQDVLKKLPTDENLRDYLQVPKLSNRVYELAFNITRNAKTPYEKALAIRNYLLENYIYDENPIPPIPGIDPVEWFLFYTKRGVCLDFNTAFVILARIAGIPARLVTGYKIDPIPGEQIVRAKQAHAWAEIYLKGVGWIPIDATGYRRSEKPKTKKEEPLEANLTILPNGTLSITFSRALNDTIEITTYSKNMRIKVNGTQVLVPLNISSPEKITVRVGNNIFEKIINWVPSVVIVPKNLTITKGGYGSIKVITQEKVSVRSELPYILMKRDFGYEVKVYGEDVGDYPVEIAVGSTIYTVHVKVGIKTYVRILKWPSRVEEGEKFLIEGVVTSENGEKVDGGKVIVEARTDKRKPGIKIGEGKVRNGKFTVRCVLNKTGEYELVAVYAGYSFFLPSVSDPKIKVIARSKILANKFNVTSVGLVKIRGILVTNSGKALGNRKVYVYLDGNIARVLLTEANGMFQGYIKVLTPGFHEMKVIYPGDELSEPSNVTWRFLALKLKLDYPVSVKGGEDIKIFGKVYGITSGTLVVESKLGKRIVEIRNGEFRISFPTRRDSEGLYRFSFFYNGTEIKRIAVFVKPRIIIRVSGTILVSNKSKTIRVKVLSPVEEPIPGAKVIFQVGNVSKSNVTNERGVAEFTISFKKPGKYPANLLIIMQNGFVSYPFYIRVLRFPLYIYALLVLTILLGTYFGIKGLKLLMAVDINLDRDPPVYTSQDEIRIILSKPASLFINGKFVGKGREFRVKLSPGVYRVQTMKWGIKGSEKKILVVDSLNDAVVKIFLEKYDGAPGKTVREILGKSVLTEIFEKARYGNVSLSFNDFKTFIKLVGGKRTNAGKTKE